MDAPTYDILIATIPHRHRRLCALLEHLDAQMAPGAGALLVRDNLERTISSKFQQLMESSQADYISWIDDDDWVPDDFVPTIMEALQSRPDYVGFNVDYRVCGVPQIPVEHSLRNKLWVDGPDKLYRDITALNPIRRELATLGRWEDPGNGADRRWAAMIAGTGRVKTEVFIDRSMYVYLYDPMDCHQQIVPKQPLPPEGAEPELPSYPWLTVLQSVETA